MELQEIITEIILGLFLIFISYQVGCKGNFSLIHSYHYRNLDPKDTKSYTKRIGMGGMFVGIGVFLIPILNLIFRPDIGYYIGVAMIVVGVVHILFFIIKYNSKLIRFKRK